MGKNKKELRKEMQEKLASLSKEERQTISQKLQNELFKLEVWQEAKVIGIYLSFGTEWDTRNIIEEAWDSGKDVVIPKTIPKTKGMKFYQIDDYSDVEKGHMGIQEPITDRSLEIEKENIDLLIVPGLVFSYAGYRVGFGGGYYDRYLADFIHPTISLVWTGQLAKSLPTNKYDLPVQHVLTENGVI